MEETLHWYDPYSGLIIPDNMREARLSGSFPALKGEVFQKRATEYERLSTEQVIARLQDTLHRTVTHLGVDKFQEIMMSMRPCSDKTKIEFQG